MILVIFLSLIASLHDIPVLFFILNQPITDINHRFVHKTPLHKLLKRWGNSNGAEPKTMEKLDTSSSKKAYPAFVLNLSCQLSEYDITFEATKTYVEFKVVSSISLDVFIAVLHCVVSLFHLSRSHS